MKEPNEQQNPNNAQFIVQRLYVKDLSFETKNTPKVFQQQWEPELNLDLNTDIAELEANVYEVALRVTVTVKNKNEVAFLIEVNQAGIFTIQGAPKEQMDHLLNSFCPNILYPYAREAVSSEVARGSFPQLVLAPINFDALYMQKLEERKKSQTAESSTETH